VLKWSIRSAAILMFLSMFLFHENVSDHFRAHFTGAIEDDIIKGEWHVVLINIVIFLSFLVPLSFRRKIDWKEYSIVAAFIVSLFVEMYGIPLTVLFASGAVGGGTGVRASTVLSVDLLGVTFGFTIPMIYGTLMMVLGTALIVIGWVSLYLGMKRKLLVTDGIYSISRNPQYVGFILIILGWLIGWPTILVVIFAPLLVFMYIRLCVVEGRELERLEGYEEYSKTTPLLI